MTITNGQNADAGDFITASAGAGSAGKVAKLDAAGKHDASFKKIFGCKVYQNSSSSTGSGSYSIQNFQLEEFDTDSMHENVSHPDRITFNTAGYYLVGATIGLGTSVTGGLRIVLNGSTTIGGGSTTNNGGAVTTHATGSLVRHFAANDYITVGCSTNGASSSSGDERTNFWAILLQAD
jgi:hypothetical protein